MDPFHQGPSLNGIEVSPGQRVRLKLGAQYHGQIFEFLSHYGGETVKTRTWYEIRPPVGKLYHPAKQIFELKTAEQGRPLFREIQIVNLLYTLVHDKKIYADIRVTGALPAGTWSVHRRIPKTQRAGHSTRRSLFTGGKLDANGRR